MSTVSTQAAANAYKNLKEQFVSGHSGGSIWEINLVTAIAPAAYLLWAALQSRYGFFRRKTPLAHITDFLINVGGLLLALTLYSTAPGLLLSLFLAPTLLIFALPAVRQPKSPVSSTKKVDSKNPDLPKYPRRPFLTAYRGGMLVITSIAILAVDFKIFPRRFAKVETWGTSLMDVGVGSFVFAAGLASSKAFVNGMSSLDGEPARQKTLLTQVAISVRQSLPLLVLGATRLISVKNLDYAEHVSEYGVHWNFFFTLATIPLALCFIQPLIAMIPGISHGYLGLLIAAIYEIALQNTQLKAWILTAPRTDLLSQNKEGIFSCIGYLAIFLLGVETGGLVLPRKLPQIGLLSRILRLVGLKAESRGSLLISLGLLAATYSTLLVPFYTPRWFPWLSIGVSRRLANAPYVLWIGAYNTMQILMFALVESIIFPAITNSSSIATEKEAAKAATPLILDDYNSGGLVVFLVANLGTGLVNLTIDTLKINNVQAFAILTVYMAVVTFIARVSHGIKLKI